MSSFSPYVNLSFAFNLRWRKKTIYNKRIERSERKSRKASYRVVLGYLNWTSGLHWLSSVVIRRGRLSLIMKGYKLNPSFCLRSSKAFNYLWILTIYLRASKREIIGKKINLNFPCKRWHLNSNFSLKLGFFFKQHNP